MFRKLTYKKRFQYLLAGTAILVFIVYFLAIKPTFDLRKRYTELKNNIATASDAPVKISMLENKLKNYSFLFSTKGEGTGNHEKIHEFISQYCYRNNLTFTGYQPLHTYNESNYIIETNIADMEDKFVKLVGLLYEIETSMGYGKVVSVKFYSKTDLHSKVKRLFMTVYIQHIINNSNEK